MSDTPKLSTNPLFDVIKPEVDDQRQFTVMTGYVAAVTDDLVKVYPTLDLSTYLEIPRADIVWAEPEVPGQHSSPTKLVIKGTANSRRIVSARRNVEEGFLTGLIASKNLSTAVPCVTVEVKLTPEAGPGGCPPPPTHVETRSVRPGTDARTHCFATGVCFSDAGL